MPLRPGSPLTIPVKQMTKIVSCADHHFVNCFRQSRCRVSISRAIDCVAVSIPLIMAVLIGVALSPAAPVEADVTVFDQITAVKKPVFIKIMTKGRVFPAGGQRVVLRIGTDRPYHLLSGGDGYAYLKYVPRNAGVAKMVAVSGDDRAGGILLVVNSAEKALVIGAEGVLRASLLLKQSNTASRKALIRLGKHFRIVYLTRWIGPQMLKDWLAREKYPSSVVLGWKSPEVFERLQHRGVAIAAVIGSNALLKAAREHVERRYSFEKTTSGATVKDWPEIIEQLTGKSGSGAAPRP